MEEGAQKKQLAYYEEFLMQLPKEESSVSARIDAILKLTHYSWLLNDLKKFSGYLNDGIDLLNEYPISQYQAWMLNARGIGLYEEGSKKEAEAQFTQALRHDPNNSAIGMNVSIATHGLGKNGNAIRAGKHVINKDPENFNLWRVLGYLLLSMGKIEDATDAMKKAQNINPQSADTHYSLAICYYKNEQPAECAKELSKAEKISLPQNAIQQACVEILGSKTDEALLLLKYSLETKVISKHHILRDPNLYFLLNLQELMMAG
jgi:tetratricopeptide (TPR) repeat protein